VVVFHQVDVPQEGGPKDSARKWLAHAKAKPITTTKKEILLLF
jgi:hypothetical protein